jgi:hypothetical protein
VYWAAVLSICGAGVMYDRFAQFSHLYKNDVVEMLIPQGMSLVSDVKGTDGVEVATFTSVVDLRKVDLGVVAGVSLRLDKVEVFRKSIEALPRGYSAGLYLSGDGIELVRQALQDRRERESLTHHLD